MVPYLPVRPSSSKYHLKILKNYSTIKDKIYSDKRINDIISLAEKKDLINVNNIKSTNLIRKPKINYNEYNYYKKNFINSIVLIDGNLPAL